MPVDHSFRETAFAMPLVDYANPTRFLALQRRLAPVLALVTAVLFSAIETEAVAPPPFEVMTGASFALVMVTAIACTSVPPSPSETVTCTS